jgi:hypothetical protein
MFPSYIGEDSAISFIHFPLWVKFVIVTGSSWEDSGYF